MCRYFIAIILAACFTLHAAEMHIAILVFSSWQGEVSHAHRIQQACKNINWDADIIFHNDRKKLQQNKYSFVINLTPGVYKRSKCKNYVAIFHPTHHFFKDNGFLKEEYSSYDGYLLTYSPDAFGRAGNNFVNKRKFPYIRWYPTAQRREFKKVEPTYLFHIPSLWGDRMESDKFQHCFSLLDKEPYMRFYGHPDFQKSYPQSYKGQIPFDSESLYEMASDAGVMLVLHSSDHNRYGIPSGRIFEALAASTVIISDQNSFVMEHFKDSVLYIDTSVDGLSIYSQIHQHMEWIRNNKNEALEKAKMAHQIYMQKFLLEDQLLTLGKLHDRLSNNQ